MSKDIKEKFVSSFVDYLYGEEVTWYGDCLIESYDLDKTQFKDLLMKPNEDRYIQSKEVSNLIIKFTTNLIELTKLWDVMTNIDKLFECDMWKWNDGFLDDFDNQLFEIIKDILKILNVKFIESREVV